MDIDNRKFPIFIVQNTVLFSFRFQNLIFSPISKTLGERFLALIFTGPDSSVIRASASRVVACSFDPRPRHTKGG